MKASKKLLSLLLVAMLLVSAIPFQAFAAEVHVPVMVVKQGGTNLGMNLTLSVPDEGVTLSKELGDSLLGASSDYETVCWKSVAFGNELPLTETLTNATASTQGYSIILVVKDKEVTPPPTTPTTFTFSFKLKVNGEDRTPDLASLTLGKINLGDANLPGRVFKALDTDKQNFVWQDAEGKTVTGWQDPKADAEYTLVVTDKPVTPPTKPTLTVKVFVNNVGKADFTRQTDSVTLNKTLYEDIMNAGSLGNVDDYVFNFYDGTAISGTSLNGSTYTLTADRTFTIVIKTKPADPVKKNVTFFVDGKQYAVTECTEGQLPVIPQAPYKANYTFQGWFSAENGAGSKLIANQNWDNNKPVLYYAYFTSNLNPAYDTITVYVQRYVGNVAKGAKEELTIADNQLLRGERILPWLNSKTTEIDSLIDTKYGTDYTWDGYFYDNDSNAKLTSQDQTTNGNKRVFIKIQVAEVKVQLYIHKDKASASPVIKDMHGFRIGDTISKSIDVDPLVKKYYTGSKMTIQGLYTEEDYNDLLKNLTPTAAQDLRVTEAGMEIHVIVKNGTASTADPSNPKTGDYILSTAMTLMVISGLAAAAVYVVGKKRRV